LLITLVNIMSSNRDSNQGSAGAVIHRMSEDRFRDFAESPPPSTSPSRSREEHLAWALDQVRQALAGIRFGQVVITIQDGLPIQIERTEKTRLR
jgi:hypothetical protein